MNIFFTKHSIQRMFERDITEEDVEYAISNGDVINNYPNDKPYPSVLIYCRVANKPLHVVYSIDDSNKEEKLFYVITVYRPTLEEWYNDFKTTLVGINSCSGMQPRRHEMTCVLCKSGHYEKGFTTVVLTKADSAVIIKGVPAMVCDQCGEYILDGKTTKLVLAMAEEAYSKGAEVEIRRFVA